MASAKMVLTVGLTSLTVGFTSGWLAAEGVYASEERKRSVRVALKVLVSLSALVAAGVATRAYT